MQGFNRISADEAKKLMDESAAVAVDIRDDRSFGMGRIPGAIKIDNTNVQQFIDDTDEDAHVIVCCYHGNMSQSGASFFAQQGLKNVYSLDGGFTGWSMLFPDQVER